jgi:hypothetical protein
MMRMFKNTPKSVAPEHSAAVSRLEAIVSRSRIGQSNSPRIDQPRAPVPIKRRFCTPEDLSVEATSE